MTAVVIGFRCVVRDDTGSIVERSRVYTVKAAAEEYAALMRKAGHQSAEEVRKLP